MRRASQQRPIAGSHSSFIVARRPRTAVKSAVLAAIATIDRVTANGASLARPIGAVHGLVEGLWARSTKVA